MYGKIGSPCLIPQEGLKDSSLPPLKRMKTVGDEIQSIIRAIRFGGKLKWISTSRITLYSSLSKAFSRSSFKAITPKWPFFFSIE